MGEQISSSSHLNLILTDALGSVLSTFSNTYNSAALLGNQTYGPYGSQQYQSGSMGTTKGFTGQYNDSVTGLDYYHTRYYDPVAGVFLSADGVQGNGQGMNPYGYVNGNPETLSDPSGAYVACGDTCGQGPGSGNGTGGGSGSGSGSPPESTGGSGSGSPPASTGGATDWSRFTVPFKIHPTATSSSFNQNASVLPPCVGMSYQDCLSLLYATSVPYEGYTTTSTSISLDGPGLSTFGPWGLTWTGFHSTITVQTLVHVSGELVMPMGGCASLFSCLTNNEGVDDRLPDDYMLYECSFTATTKVATQEGTQAIGTLKPGEKVLAYNPKTQKMELQPILHVWIHHDNDLVDLTLTTRTHAPHSSQVTTTSEVIHTNQKHPFLTIEHGFLAVGKITLGMHLLRADGRIGVVTGWKVVPGIKTMYNLKVQQDHTFTVGDGQWVVHNCGARPYDVVPYEPRNSPFENHHGILDVWARNNIAGYDGAEAPTVVLTPEQHNATRSVFASWRYDLTGSVTGAIDWNNVSASDIYSLAERMFDAADVPIESRQAYYRAFNQFIYTESFTPFAYR